MEGRQFIMDKDANKRTWPKQGDPLAPGGRIGARLRALYSEIEKEPVPGDLLDLLEKLDEAELRQKK